MTVEMKPFGDTGVRIGFNDEISIETNKQIRSLLEKLKKAAIPGVIEWIPAYTALTVIYDPSVCRYERLTAELKKLTNRLTETDLPAAERVRLPVYYGGEGGPDLDHVAAMNGISAEEVINIHSGNDYFIYLIGFTPGFPYLGGMPKSIAAPRHVTPRKIVPAGSVGIAGEQTGVYSMSTPGGWQLIGHTPVPLYDPAREKPVLLKTGDYLRFDPVSSEEYNRIVTQINEGTYELTVEPYIEPKQGAE